MDYRCKFKIGQIVKLKESYISHPSFLGRKLVVHNLLIGDAPFVAVLHDQVFVGNMVNVPLAAIEDFAADGVAEFGQLPQSSHQSELWKNEGRCPVCGELGRYSMSVPTCSKHGVY